MKPKSRLVLGTAQLGMPYGISNKTGQPDMQTAEEIIAAALENGVFEFDTAQAYGRSEEVLGAALKRLAVCDSVRVVTKLKPELRQSDFPNLKQGLEQSLDRLNVPRLHGLLLHNEEQLDLWDKGLGEMLIEFVREGLVDRLGVSVYKPFRAAQALQTQGIDMLQLPANVFDRRFEDAGIFSTARHKKKHIYVRSIFLQGLLLMDVSAVPSHMRFALPDLKNLEKLAAGLGVSRQELSLGYVKQAFPEARVVFGAETVAQIRMNARAWDKDHPEELLKRAREDFRGLSEQILNPGLWPGVN
ncbi:MAG: aldo/keto reductase [Proteobacteria bacterium]|nr:aldo/keto reductase [Pseudomonadota bacterium]